MARNRMIKPDFWGDEKLSQLSFEARLTYIALWNFSDDWAVVKGNSRWLKNNIFPYDDGLEIDRFDGWIGELERARRIVRFQANGEAFFWIPKFLEHQKIKKPSIEKKNPAVPEQVVREFYNSGEAVGNYGGTVPPLVGTENKIKENKIKENNRFAGTSGELVGEVVCYLNSKTKSNFNPMTYQTQMLIWERMQEGFSLDDFKAVIDSKVDRWLDDKKMSGNLRPSTLFASDKFEGYLQEAKRNGKGEKIETAKGILKFDGEDICRQYCAEHGIDFEGVRQ